MRLNQKTIPGIDPSIRTPNYNRQQLKTGIVHVGVGGFHRAHQAVVTQQLIEMGGNNNWGICGVGLREGDRKIADIFEKQDCLYTLITRHPGGKVECDLMAQMTDFLLAPDDKQAVINRMTHQETKIVSLTITEGGYNLRSDGEFDIDHPDIQHEINNPHDPRTVYGYLFAALKKRKEAGLKPFTIMSCDNIQHNGAVIKKMMCSFAKAQDPDFANWIASHVAFPNSMVDRITPVTTQAELDYLKEHCNLEDEWPVTCEPFLQWIIEDNFSDGRPDFDQIAGVQFVPDVTPYEKMKIRLLNAGHSVLGIFGALLAIPTIDACMDNDQLRKTLRKFWDEEATPILDEVEGIDLDEYKNSLQERFGNPNIKDKVSRICSESSAKLPTFLLPTIAENIQKGGNAEIATLLIAAWCYYSDKQIDRNGNPLEIIDAMKETLQAAATQTHAEPLAFLGVNEVFGQLGKNQNFKDLYANKVKAIYKNPDISAHMADL
ncbi:MAG: mannitol dehydrogenase family protein [Cyclobacteriaceae bacterium]